MTIERAGNPPNYYLFKFKDESAEIICHPQGVILVWELLVGTVAP